MAKPKITIQYSDEFETFARALVNLPDSGGQPIFSSPQERIDWLKQINDIDDGETGNDRDRFKVAALRKAGLGNSHAQVLPILDDIHRVEGQPAGYNQNISLWRYAYEQFSKRVKAERIEGALEVINVLERLKAQHPGGVPISEIEKVIGRYKNLKLQSGVSVKAEERSFEGRDWLEFRTTISETGY